MSELLAVESSISRTVRQKVLWIEGRKGGKGGKSVAGAGGGRERGRSALIRSRTLTAQPQDPHRVAGEVE